MSYVNLNNPANFQLQEFEQLGFRYIVSGRPTIGGETYRTIFVLTDAVVTATCPNGDSLSSETLVAGTVIHGFFEDVSVASGSLLAYKAGPITAQEIFDAYKAYVYAQGGIVEGESCAVADIAALLEDKLYSAASLVLIPSGYKVSHLYAERPLDSNGDFTFTRASSATRVGPDGLIQRVRTNLILQSNTFSNASWTNNTLVTANNQISPDGTLDASTFTSDGAYHGLLQSLTITSVPHTFSIYAKAGNYSIFRIVNVSSLTNVAWFNLSTGVTSGAIGGTSKIEAVGNGWFRCSYSTNSPNTSTTNQGFVLSDAMGSLGGVPSGSNMYFWKSQVETGDIATDYIATTSAAVSVGPVANFPRLDYLGSSCPRLLLEPQRTNLVKYSEQFDNAGWAKSGASVLANAVLGPDGYTSADKLVEDTSTGAHIATQSNLFTATGAWHTASIFVKAAERTYAAFSTRGNFTSNDNTLIFNLTTGEWELDDSVQNYALNAEAFPNGWYRISLNTDTTSGAYDGFGIGIATGSTSWIDAVYTGDGTSGIYIWGAQMEAGQYESSLIPTLVASVTRGEDYCSKTGISSLIGQTEGVVFVEYNQSLIGQSATRRIFALSDGTTSNRITAYVSSSNGIDFYVRNSGGDLFLGTAASPIGNTKGVHKIAAAYKNGDYAVYLDGVQIISGAGTAGTLPTCSRFDLGNQLGSNHLYEPMMQALLFKTRLTNADLAALTTP
jgi:hypothetical protein